MIAPHSSLRNRNNNKTRIVFQLSATIISVDVKKNEDAEKPVASRARGVEIFTVNRQILFYVTRRAETIQVGDGLKSTSPKRQVETVSSREFPTENINDQKGAFNVRFDLLHT